MAAPSLCGPVGWPLCLGVCAGVQAQGCSPASAECGAVLGGGCTHSDTDPLPRMCRGSPLRLCAQGIVETGIPQRAAATRVQRCLARVPLACV
eukprot:5752783-Prymnesium_polylepis.1